MIFSGKSSDTGAKRPGVIRKTFRLWFSGPIAATNQIRESGKRFVELAAEAAGQQEEDGEKKPITYAEALAARPKDSSSPAEIRRVFARFKNIATFFLLVSITTALSNLVLGVWAGTFMAAAMTFLSFAFSFRFSLRIWQIDNEALVNVAEYRARNSAWLLDTLLFAKAPPEQK